MSIRYKRLLVTGGAGFIGSSFIRYALRRMFGCEILINLDCLTYAADLSYLQEIESDPRYVFVCGDIRDEELVGRLCADNQIDAIVHFAAESHVDRSILGPKAFLETNVAGTVALLEVLRKYPHIHFHHVSTDEVYGSLSDEGFFAENIPDLEHVKKIYDHDLERLILLVRLEGFQRQFQELKRASPDFEAHWSAVKDWKSSSRYVIWDQKSAGTLLSAVHDPEYGVFQWIRRFW